MSDLLNYLVTACRAIGPDFILEHRRDSHFVSTMHRSSPLYQGWSEVLPFWAKLSSWAWLGQAGLSTLWREDEGAGRTQVPWRAQVLHHLDACFPPNWCSLFYFSEVISIQALTTCLVDLLWFSGTTTRLWRFKGFLCGEDLVALLPSCETS